MSTDSKTVSCSAIAKRLAALRATLAGATMACPECGEHCHKRTPQKPYFDILNTACLEHGIVHICDCDTCQGTGLAFEWASAPCICLEYKGIAEVHSKRGSGCRGSGRVPKDVGLEELMMRFEPEMHPPGGLTEWIAVLPTGEQGEGETPLLAALRAIAAQVGIPQGKDA